MDLRVCLRSADKEIAEIKMELKEERHTHQTKSMEYIQRVGVCGLCQTTLNSLLLVTLVSVRLISKK